jgi:sirohydrochlorin ferrochelatase
MKAVLIDNGSLEPAAHRNLRALAAAISTRIGIEVHAVSWKHSDRIPASNLAENLDSTPHPAWTLRTFVAEQFARGERDFVFVPFFISAQGAIGSALRADLDSLQQSLGAFEVTFTDGLAARGAIPAIVASRIRATIAQRFLHRPTVIVVDHGGPSASSATLRNELAAQIRRELGSGIGALAAASLEGEEYPHNRPLLADQLNAPGFNCGDVIIAPLFLAPGRHAGPEGDLAQIARAAQDRAGAAPNSSLRCHVTGLVGTHPLVADALTEALRTTLSTLHAQPFA